ncbi:hypothetical protein DVT68_17800 [Dyella solisilvae]|uniref:Uncharacterized protein n=1 Tax=Dyella solisilvae TaxID=1920168 RepID=A0A370K3J1_9GAMM|nr:hypothetical protein [Dyella solisilvae]RDI97211.1 hypothetical protein DVT68_17800 [Dyella solisilvae]
MTHMELPPRRDERIEPSWDRMLPPELPPRTPPPPRRESGYIVAHWRGELPLAYSYWCNGVLLGLALLFIETMMLALLREQHLSLTQGLVLSASWMAMRLAVSVWQVVGILRSAAASGSKWAVPVNILMVLTILGAVGKLPGEITTLQKIAHGAAEQRRLSNFTIAPDPSGAAILARGNIGVGYADAIADAFTAHPQIHRLVLDSLGGDVGNGLQLHDYLAAHPSIGVEVDHACVSACTLAFIGAAERIVSAHGTLGFHQMRSMIDSGASKQMVGDEQAHFMTLLSALGASPDFIRLAFAKQGDDYYAPNADSLFANHIITGLRLDDRVVNAAQWRTEQFLYSFNQHDHSRAMGQALALIRQQWPAIYDAWVARDLRIEQEPDQTQRMADYNTSTWRALHAARSAAMRTVTADHVRRFAMERRALLNRIRDRVSADACGRYLSGVGFQSAHETDAVYQANGESYLHLLTDNDPSRAITINAALGERALSQVRAGVEQATPVTSGANYHPQLCRQQIALLDGLLGLSPLESDMALRRLFAGSD